ncbi:von Willebrand factor D and EGF domain-containing protein-like [Crassostrea angulata]|uniref:von Willebrand factor D and EGF domain-containing protein-like n=1 Tax=Magallana angulata TaxID=2784310 RepID=UPI0022B0A8AA|nr:von Willebrand factor D and EGF domain-containing protein-like [Crassostrea angulata]
MTFKNKEIKSVKGVHNTIAEIQCNIPQPYIAESDPDLKDVFIHGYRISVSNTGKEYSISRPLFILDSTCQIASNLSGSIVFILKENFCFINGNCITNGTIDGSNKCRTCQTNLQKFSWSWMEGCGKSDKNYLWILGAVLGGLAFLVSIIGLTLLVVKHKRPRIDAFVEELSNEPPSTMKSF